MPQRSELGIKVSGAIESACQAVISAADELTEMDRITGDGDLGSSMERAAKAVLEHLPSYPLNDIAATLRALAHTVRRELGGSSGPLYGVLLLRCGTVLEGSGTVGISQWAEALAQGSQAISELGGAKPGDRTMLDALDPFVQNSQESCKQPAAARSDAGCGRGSRTRSGSDGRNETPPGAVQVISATASWAIPIPAPRPWPSCCAPSTQPFAE